MSGATLLLLFSDGDGEEPIDLAQIVSYPVNFRKKQSEVNLRKKQPTLVLTDQDKTG